MQISKFIKFLLISLAFLASSAGAQSLPKVSKSQVDVYYTTNVTKADATKLLNYLLTSGFYSGDEPGECLLDKTNKTFEFKFVVKKGLDTDPEVINIFKQLSKEMSKEAFNGASVDVHLLDENLKLLRVVVAF